MPLFSYYCRSIRQRTQHAYTPVDILRLLLELEFTFLSCTHFSLRCCVCVYTVCFYYYSRCCEKATTTEASYSLTAACWANIFIHKERTMSAVCCCYIVHYAVLLSYPSTLCASSSFFLCLNNGSLYLFTRLLFLNPGLALFTQCNCWSSRSIG